MADVTTKRMSNLTPGEAMIRHMLLTAVCSIDEVACRLMNNENTTERTTQMTFTQGYEQCALLAYRLL